MLYARFLYSVRLIGLEPTRITTPDPKSGASTNFATSAIQMHQLHHQKQSIFAFATQR